ncbi:MAG: nucleotidyl transferase AbiEii/AbiGii toxin family protein [Thaumarchaeota archaeon]|nr:nucleotidyl transferase AbiEii/AbiGii toxin family protein [Nitrososphaerota archaeon]MDG6909664.1 nucleotidyl transferase AbiEii/AbiGii toxin family protein [Nitrososphaerota archaeon]
MLRTPLARRLKRRNHREVAFAQDVLVGEAYDAYPACVLHGGTAIWRCYGGSRFSEDLDVYLPGASAAADSRFRQGVLAKGAKELKFRRTGRTLCAKFEIGGGTVSFEGALRDPPGREVRGYETLSGGSVMVSVLPPGELLVEKASAYADRRKVRDLYDVLFLTGAAEADGRARGAVRSLLDGYAPPVDGRELKALVLTGVVPTPGEMVEALERWARKST